MLMAASCASETFLQDGSHVAGQPAGNKMGAMDRLQFNPAPRSWSGHLFCRGLERSQDDTLLLACRNGLLTKPTVLRHLRL
jgi:hypothetical protein